MGYTTDFIGGFTVLDAKTQKWARLKDGVRKLIIGLSETRRMKRDVDEKYGVEGEFYVDGGGECGQAPESNIIEHNSPPATQPSLWCDWTVLSTSAKLPQPFDNIVWNGGEKFYSYIEWINYIHEVILKPQGYTLDGTVEWLGEDPDDRGKIEYRNGELKVYRGTISYEEEACDGFLNLETPGDSSAVIKVFEEEPVKNETN